MKPLKTLAGIASTSALVFGGVDASTLREEPLQRVERVAGYEIRAEQKGNTVETAFPWKDQPGFKVKYDMGEPSLTEKVKDKRNKEVITEVVTDFEGGFKVDILLNEKPDTNQFCYTIEGAENYDFFYQPPLTQEEKDQGSHRPPEIEGSYAVYHKTLKNHVIGQENYATGKVMHIPRPQVWELENESEKVWADLSYDAGQLCVTVPQDFLDVARYPVRVDPTFGYTSMGSSENPIGTASAGSDFGYRYGMTATSSLHGTPTSVTVGLCGSTGGGVTCGGAYNVPVSVFINEVRSFNTHPQIAFGEATTSVSASFAWATVTISNRTNDVFDELQYILSASADPSTLPGNDSIFIAYDSVLLNAFFYQKAYSGDGFYPSTKENPFRPDAPVTDQYISIYATYDQIYERTMNINNGTIRINNGTIDI